MTDIKNAVQITRLPQYHRDTAHTEDEQSNDLHPGITHAQLRNLAWSSKEARDVINRCSGCMELDRQLQRLH